MSNEISESSDCDNQNKSTNDEENDDDTTTTNSAETEVEDSIANKAATALTTSSQVKDCLLLRDTSRHAAPLQLHELFKNFQLQLLTSAEILFQLIYIIAMESGFAEYAAYEKCLPNLNMGYPLSNFFDLRNVICLSKHKPTYTVNDIYRKFQMKLKSIAISQTYSSSIDLIFKLNGIVTGEIMIVTLTPIRNESVKAVEDVECIARSMGLIIPRYIVGTAWKDGIKPFHRYLAKMDEFSNILRDALFYPVQNDYLAMLGVELYPALLGLPDELYDNIFHCLSPNQLRILANVNKQLHQLVINSKHYKREPESIQVRNTTSFLSPSRSRSSFRFGWETLY